MDFPEFRQEMIDGWREKKVVYFAPGGARPKVLVDIDGEAWTLPGEDAAMAATIAADIALWSRTCGIS